MKQLVLNCSILFLVASSCGENGTQLGRVHNCIMYGEECVKPETRIIIERQPDNTGVPQPTGSPVPGPSGATGPQGPKGNDGQNCTVRTTPQGAEISCPDGSSAIVANGSNGTDGSDGQDGSSCSVTQTSNGSIINCTDGTSAVILNGQDGSDGVDGQDAAPTAYTVVEIKDPCGDQSGFDEVLLKMANGKWVAHFSGSGNNFLTILTPGTYQTTDQTRCRFTLNSSGQIVNEYNY